MDKLFSLFDGNSTSAEGLPLERHEEFNQSVPGISDSESEDPSNTALLITAAKSTSKRRSSAGRRSDEDLKASVLNQKIVTLMLIVRHHPTVTLEIVKTIRGFFDG